MNTRKFVLRSASFLTAASAALWLGSAVAAPLLPSYSSNSSTLFAAVMQASAPIEETDSSETLPLDLRRQVVDYATPAAPGTIIIDTVQTHLYLVLGNGKAIRYGIGVGRDGFTWSGSQAVTRMAGLDATARDDRAPALPAALDGRRQRQPARRPGDLSWQHSLPNPRYECAGDDRHQGFKRLHPPDQC
jgi:hypothetical protein